MYLDSNQMVDPQKRCVNIGRKINKIKTKLSSVTLNQNKNKVFVYT